MFGSKGNKKKVFLTKTQKRIFDLYVKKGYTQPQIAQLVYGSLKCQGLVSRNIKQIGKKLGVDLVVRHGGRYKREEYEIDMDEVLNYKKEFSDDTEKEREEKKSKKNTESKPKKVTPTYQGVNPIDLSRVKYL